MLLAIALGVALSYYLYFMRQRASDLRIADRNNEHLVELMAAVLRTSGRPGLSDFLKLWKPQSEERVSVRVVPPARAALSGRRPYHIESAFASATPTSQPWAVVVSSPDGTWQLTYTGLQFSEPSFLEMLGYLLRTQALIVELIASLAFSALLAWYLTRPIHRLRVGFEQLARGDLRARLHARAWRRRDEISDLARDFDRVAERLEQLVLARDQLLHDVSHELRTPLARLRLSIDLAKQADAAASEAGQAALPDVAVADPFARIDAECQRVDRLVGELLTLSRAESDASRRDEYFDVPELVRTVVGAAELEAHYAGVTMQMSSQDEELSRAQWVMGDAELLRRGLENILRNALRHSPPGRSVDIAVRPWYAMGDQERDLSGYEIEIADQGPGVPDTALEKIFEPFLRLPGERNQGFGLGLAIARRAVQVHGGTVRAVNRPGGGLSVVTLIPINRAASAQERALQRDS